MKLMEKAREVDRIERKKEEWDTAQRLPQLPDHWSRAWTRKYVIYDVEEGQYFERAEDGLVVRIEFVSKSHLVLALDVRTREVYSCFEPDFNTRETKWGAPTIDEDGMWTPGPLMWQRISENEAKRIRRRYQLRALYKLWSIFRR